MKDKAGQKRKLTISDLNRPADGEQGTVSRIFEVRDANEETRTVELAFSSEAEFKRWWGIEVLGHEPGEVVLDRMSNGAALLVNHDWDDQVGVVESVRIDADRKGRAVVRFGRSTRAEEIFQDVKDGIRKLVSVGYRIHDAQLVETRNGDTDVYRVTKWEPFEVSIVSVPADPSVGVGRSMGTKAEIPQEETNPQPAETANVRNTVPVQPTGSTSTMKTKNVRNARGDLVKVELDDAGNIVREIEVLQTAAEHQAERTAGGEVERTRVRSLQEMADQYTRAVPNASELVRKAISEGHSAEQFSRTLLEAVNARGNRPLNEQTQDAAIGLTDEQIRGYSFVKAVRALANPTDRQAQKEAGFEIEASRAAAQAAGREAQGIMVPAEVLARSALGQRAMNTSTAGGGAGNTGGYAVQTEYLTGSFIDMLRTRNTIMQLGFVMAGLRGNIDIPKLAAGASGYWLGEDDDAQETGIELGQLSMTPKTVGAFTELTRKLMQQDSMGVEQLVRRDLAIALANAIDVAGYYGSGSDKQPRGITRYNGINSVPFSAANPTFPEVVQMETEIASDEADVNSMAYVFNARMRGHFKTAQKFTGTDGSTIWEPGKTVNGYRTEVTNRIGNGEVIFGNFSDLIVGMWGGLDLTVDPYSKSKSGALRIVVFQDVDFVLRRLESFCYGKQP